MGIVGMVNMDVEVMEGMDAEVTDKEVGTGEKIVMNDRMDTHPVDLEVHRPVHEHQMVITRPRSLVVEVPDIKRDLQHQLLHPPNPPYQATQRNRPSMNWPSSSPDTWADTISTRSLV